MIKALRSINRSLDVLVKAEDETRIVRSSRSRRLSFPNSVFAASGAVRLRTNRWWINDTETLLASRTTRLKNSESLRPNSSAINNVVSPRESNLLTLLLFAFNSSTGKFACFLDNFIIIDKIYRFLLFDGFVRIFDSQRKKKRPSNYFIRNDFATSLLRNSYEIKFLSLEISRDDRNTVPSHSTKFFSINFSLEQPN